MKKALKIILIIFLIGIILGLAAFMIVGNTANAEEYKIGDEKIKSIKAVIGKRKVISTSTEIRNDVIFKEIEYTSEDVQDDMLEYVTYLRQEEDFKLIKDMDLSEIPSTVELAKQANNEDEIIVMIIDYNLFGYTITIQKGVGTLTIY